jgi:Ca-activated chloride channel family protein
MGVLEMNRRKLRIVQYFTLLALVVGLMGFGVSRLPSQQVDMFRLSSPNVIWPVGQDTSGEQVNRMTSGPASTGKQMYLQQAPVGIAAESQQTTGNPLPKEWTDTTGQAAPTATTGLPDGHPEPYPTVVVPDPQTNPFVVTAHDKLSTFALDVDTGAYTAMRNYLLAGNLPPAGMVRPEEFINYFNYDYPVPEDKAFGISVDSAPSPFNQNTHIVRVGIQAQRVPDAGRKDAVLTFVIDVSGSMAEPNRLPLVKQALRMLVNELRPTDKVGIVVYGSEARLVLEHTGLQDKGKILDAIDALDNEGSTNAEAGLKMGYELASKGFDPNAINRVILCSDGVANVGATTPDLIRAAIREYSSQGVYLTTVGFGMGDYNDHLMEQLADDGDGQYAYVDNLGAAKRVFVENLTGTLQVVAKDARVQVDFNPALVKRYRLVGYENRDVADIDFRNDAVDAGEIGAGHTVTALYEVELASDAQEGDALTVQMRYLDPRSGQATEIAQPFGRSVFGASFESANPRFQLAAAVAAFAEILKGSEFATQQSHNEVLAIAERIAPQMARDGDVQEFVELVRRARDLK